MRTNLKTQTCNDASQSDAGVWYQLRSEREEICEALLQTGTILYAADSPNQALDANQLQERLRLIDDALDRLMAGSYGDCVVCGKWIEDNKLHADPALPFCCGCQWNQKRNTFTNQWSSGLVGTRATREQPNGELGKVAQRLA
ncbi:MAG: TraR/DksA C4-type zinc finger protein [Acidobacteriota bacterium]